MCNQLTFNIPAVNKLLCIKYSSPHSAVEFYSFGWALYFSALFTPVNKFSLYQCFWMFLLLTSSVPLRSSTRWPVFFCNRSIDTVPAVTKFTWSIRRWLQLLCLRTSVEHFVDQGFWNLKIMTWICYILWWRRFFFCEKRSRIAFVNGVKID